MEKYHLPASFTHGNRGDSFALCPDWPFEFVHYRYHWTTFSHNILSSEPFQSNDGEGRKITFEKAHANADTQKIIKGYADWLMSRWKGNPLPKPIMAGLDLDACGPAGLDGQINTVGWVKVRSAMIRGFRIGTSEQLWVRAVRGPKIRSRVPAGHGLDKNRHVWYLLPVGPTV